VLVHPVLSIPRGRAVGVGGRSDARPCFPPYPTPALVLSGAVCLPPAVHLLSYLSPVSCPVPAPPRRDARNPIHVATQAQAQAQTQAQNKQHRRKPELTTAPGSGLRSVRLSGQLAPAPSGRPLIGWTRLSHSHLDSSSCSPASGTLLASLRCRSSTALCPVDCVSVPRRQNSFHSACSRGRPGVCSARPQARTTAVTDARISSSTSPSSALPSAPGVAVDGAGVTSNRSGLALVCETDHGSRRRRHPL
jgi:hypothetical protein